MTSDCIELKRKQEQEMVEEMIALYCKKKHKKEVSSGNSSKEKALCPKCRELLEYARERSRKCPFMETKTFCSNCKVHCYKPQMRSQMKEVMRFSGPRMLFHHPVMAIRHFLSQKEKNS